MMSEKSRTIACSVVAIRLSCELGDKNEAEADIVIAILGVVVVPIRNAAVLRIVVPTAATEYAVRAF